MNRIGKKTKTYLVLGLAVLISIVHTWHPVTLSSTNSGDRTMVMFFIMFFAYLAKNGSASSRIALGVGFSFFSAINLLIAIFYNTRNGNNNFIEISFWGLVLGGVGLTLLIWKDVRCFEENSVPQTAQST